MSASITLYLPGLLPTRVEAFLHMERALDSLLYLLTRATLDTTLFSSPQVLHPLARYFSGLKDKLPSAALKALATGCFVSNQQQWCSAGVIACMLDHQGIYVSGSPVLTKGQEKQSLEGFFEGFLKQTGFKVYQVAPMEWVFPVSQHLNVQMVEPFEVIAKNMFYVLPSGEDNVYWRRLLTESQMCLKAWSGYSTQTEAYSAWFWGIGALPEAVSSHFDYVLSSQGEVKGLAKLAGIDCHALPSCFSSNLLSHPRGLVIDPTFLFVSPIEDVQAWRTSITAYEQNWFAPLLQLLKQGKIASLNLHLGKHYNFLLTRKHLKYFWKRSLSFDKLLSKLEKRITSFSVAKG